MAKSNNKTKEKVILKEPIYYLKIITNNDIYEATGDDLNELIINFTPPVLLKNETNIIARKNKKTIQKDLKVYDARRIFNNRISMILFTNNLIKQLG